MKVFYGSWQESLKRSGRSEEDPMVMPWLFSKPFRKEHPERVREIKARLTGGYLAMNSSAFERQMKANVKHDLRGQLNRITVPTLILVGKQDELTPPRMAKELKAEIPDARLIVLEHGGHGLYWEVPELFNKAVLGFLHEQM
ncbi:MAG: alpha/beta fold hydrolase [Desulfobacteraceae bacterium]|jgi:pimeloyl-ACP methyl ester carboxylesterase